MTVAPGWRAEATVQGEHLNVFVAIPGIAPPVKGDPEDVFPGSTSVLIDHQASATEYAVAIVATIAMISMHDAIEWVRVDGERLATPHHTDPNCDTQLWQDTFIELCTVVRSVMERSPS